MSQPKTLKDLSVLGDLTAKELAGLASTVFNTDTVLVLNGYEVRLPAFDTLPPHVQGFIRKAILESSVTNILDAVSEVAPAEYDLGKPILPKKTRKPRKTKSKA